MLCCNCFATDVAPDQPCPQCGFLSNVDTANYPMALTLGSILQERYIIGRPLGQGGFGITYLAWDNTLNAKVAIKEFLPESIAFRQRDGVSVTPFTSNREDDYLYGLSCFLAEAQTLAKFLQHPNIVGVLNFFEENGTAYFVMDYIEGLSLKTHLKNQGGTLPWAELCALMLPVFDALESVHQAGLVHRDVTPDNIYLTGKGLVKLLDFGAARYTLGDKSKSLDVILKAGYAPKEQYIRRGHQGPFTDVYSLAATLYLAITGTLPPESLERLDEDALAPFSSFGLEIPTYVEAAIFKGLAVHAQDRFQTIAQFKKALTNPDVMGTSKKRGNRKGLTKWVAVASALAVVSGLALWYYLSPAPAEPADEATVPATVAVESELEPPIEIIPEVTLPVSYDIQWHCPHLEANIREIVDKPTGTITSLDMELVTDLVLPILPVGQSYQDFSDLAHCPNLTHITISDPTFDGFQGLPLLEGIIYLDANNTQIKDLTSLENLPNLKYLYLYETEVEDLSPLSTLTKLENLNLNSCPLADLSPLSDLPNLRDLSFGGDDFITDLTPLSAISTLRELHMGGAQVTDLTPLSSLVNLTSLELWDIGTDDFTPLSNLTNLTTLYIGYYGDWDSSTSLDFLEPLTNLTTLDFCARFTDIQPLSHLTNLRVLTLYNGTISSMEPLENLQQLTTLTLRYVDLHSDALVPLANLENLRVLSIEDAPTNLDLTPVDHVPAVSITYIDW